MVNMEVCQRQVEDAISLQIQREIERGVELEAKM
jgi:hypothetical protein